MELRKTLHRTAYQHKTVKKLEQSLASDICFQRSYLERHMIDILKLMDEIPLLTGSTGKKMTISQVGISIDPVAYPIPVLTTRS